MKTLLLTTAIIIINQLKAVMKVSPQISIRFEKKTKIKAT